ncbi:MAG: toxin TcdB middle/C-terminal domain-containing protein [Hyphomicrobiales bacterium]|nr:toxin TcdB middle/C-terminal domain-containing protein [Hyphomicrobiales bacterium]
MPGLYEHDGDEGWQPFRPFTSRLNRDMRDPNLKFVDLDGDGHADVLISEDEAFVWHASLAEQGFGPARRVHQVLDEEKGPRLVFADGTDSIYLADLSGDGLTDLVRIRNGEVCYWPNLGYARFGAKVTMDNAPYFDNPDQFDHSRIRLADIDGSGTTDIIYLHRDGVRLYFNQSGNSWSASQALRVFPGVDDIVSIVPTDLLGNGTACLVWSSPLPGDARRQMRYVNLMGERKPHLLVRTVNNLGAETRVQYAPSTKFYLQDKRDGKPWITRLPFPVHVVETVETYDHISRNRFVTRYAYHHGYFDGEEREFRGFGMVEQRDTEELAALTGDGTLPSATNLDAASHVPPVLTKTWFHTGVFVDREHISNFFAGLIDEHDRGEYYREPAWRDDDVEARKRLIEDTVLPAGLSVEEEREACRALKGSMLRQEVYALDARGTEDYPHGHPYTVTEQNFTIRRLQPRDGNRHAVFFTHAREAISYHYERYPDDPRIGHALTLEVDGFGNVLKSAALGYGRRQPDMALLAEDRAKQTQILITYTENSVTNAIEAADDYRTPLPCETRTYELTVTGLALPVGHNRFTLAEMLTAGTGAALIAYEQNPTSGVLQKRLIEHVRTLYRPDDFGVAQTDPLALLPLCAMEPLALPGESHKLAFTPGLLAGVYGGRATDAMLETEGRYVHSEGDANWWIPSGRIFFSPGSADTSAQELAYARQHFFLPHRTRDPFHTNAVSTESFVTYDAYDLLMVKTRDALGNVVTVATKDDTTGNTEIRIDYRVLQPYWVTDPNGNRTRVTFDTLGMVAGTAVMGKPLPAPVEGDSLADFVADLTQAQIDGLHDAADPHANAPALLQSATTRIVYDLDRFQRTQRANPLDPKKWLPPYAATLARETHANDPLPPQGLKIQISFSYSDGFGREIQKKIQAEPEKIGGVVGPPRWVGSGWSIFNNKGKPVRQYEPFFSQLPEKRHRFEFGVEAGVSPILFYDPVERVVATLHPNYTYEKVVFDPWKQTTYDVNDTVKSDPSADVDVKGFFIKSDGTPRIPTTDYQPTWHAQRIGLPAGDTERDVAEKAAAHTNTPTTAHFDTLGRPFLTLAHNGFNPDTTPIHFATRVELDIEGNQREVKDERKKPDGTLEQRVVMRYAYDMLGNRIHQLSMEAGARWMLNDVTGKPIRAWDSRSHTFRTEYDPLRRPLRSFVTGADPANPNHELLTERLVYGEQHPAAELRNLRGKLYLHLDQAGAVTTEAHDFKGNPRRASRRIATEYKQAINWSTVNAALPGNATAQLNPAALEAALAPRLEADTYTSRTRFDALNRPLQLIPPRSSHSGTKRNIIQPVFNEANLLERVDVWLDRATEPAGPLNPAVDPPSPVLGVNNIDYDAKGQRLRIDYKNGATTRYTYDPETFRLVHLYTRRGAAFTEDCGGDPPPPRFAAPDVPPNGTPCGLQHLYYTYDPVGNITHIRDDAQQTIYFNGQVVPPHCNYTYDAIYRLIEAAGREHIGQVGQPETTWSDEFRVKRQHPHDGQAMRTYTETYEYDAVGNFERLIHQANNGNWTRTYAYGETSLIEDGTGSTQLKTSNRLSNTSVGRSNDNDGSYLHDAHGNMIRMPHLGGAHPAPNMHWDYRDQLRQTDRGGGGTAYYVYDAAGQRVRKVWEKAPGLIEERIYLGGFEIFRRHGGAIGANTATLERETLHIMDDKQRIALVETRTLDTAGSDPAPQQLIRYQFGNHLGSASLELDDQAQIISYEEYTPYGSTSYQAVRSQTETPKRYRYTGKERDEESGLYYHGARYYAAWVGRWTTSDPAGLVDSIDLFVYSMNNPVRFLDPSGLETAESDKEGPKRQSHVIILGEEIPGREDVSGNADKWLQKILNTTTVERFSERVSPGDKLLIALSPNVTKRERTAINKIVENFQAGVTDPVTGKPTVDVTVKTVKPDDLAKEVNALDNIETLIFFGHGSSVPKYGDWASFPKPTAFDAARFSSDAVALWASCNLDVYAEKFTKHTGVTSLGVEGTTWFGVETITAGRLQYDSDPGTSKLFRFDLVDDKVQKSGPYSINSRGIPILQPRDPDIRRDPFEPPWPDIYLLAPKERKKPQKKEPTAPVPR